MSVGDRVTVSRAGSTDQQGEAGVNNMPALPSQNGLHHAASVGSTLACILTTLTQPVMHIAPAYLLPLTVS